MATTQIQSTSIESSAVTPSKLTGGQSGTAPIYGVRAYGTMTDGKSNSPSVTTNGNISSIQLIDNDGVYRVVFNIPMPDNEYAVCLTIGSNDQDHVCEVGTKTTTDFIFSTYDPGTGNNDETKTETVNIIVVG